MLGLRSIENRLVYFPISATQGWFPPVDPGVEDVWLTASDGTALHGWWYAPPRSVGTVLIFHGNAGNVSFWGLTLDWVVRSLQRSALMIDYPGYGKSGGRPSESGCYEAAEQAYAWLIDTQAIPAEQIVLYGESLGSGVAVELATRRPHEGVILVNPFTSVPDVAKFRYPFLPTRLLMENRFDNLAKAHRLSRPVLVAGSTADEVVPFRQSEILFQALMSPKMFVRFEGAGHSTPRPDDFGIQIQAFLTGHNGSDGSRR